MTATKLFTGTLLVLHFAALVSEASVSISGPVTIGASAHPRKVASSLKLPADFISVPLKLVSEQKEPAAAYQESRKAIDSIQQKAKERQNVRVVVGAADLSERQLGFGLSGGSFKQPAAVTVLHLLVPLTKEKNDIFLAGADAARFVESLRLPSKMTCHMGEIQLAIDNPEQYRTRLVGQIG